MTAAGTLPARSALARIRPRNRRRESGLLVIVALVILTGSISLGATQRELAGQVPSWLPADAGQLLVYLGVLLAAHLALIVSGRRSDQILLPTVGLLGGISLLLMERLPQSLVSQSIGGRNVRPGLDPAGLARPGHRRDHGPGDRRPFGRLAQALQVHLGGRRDRPPPADLPVRQRGQRSAPDDPDRPVQRPADRVHQGDPGDLPGRLPVRVSAAPGRCQHAARAVDPAARCRTSCRCSRCGRWPSGSW